MFLLQDICEKCNGHFFVYLKHPSLKNISRIGSFHHFPKFRGKQSQNQYLDTLCFFSISLISVTFVPGKTILKTVVSRGAMLICEGLCSFFCSQNSRTDSFTYLNLVPETACHVQFLDHGVLFVNSTKISARNTSDSMYLNVQTTIAESN